MDWVNCESCDVEFKVIVVSSEEQNIQFCPYCGSEIEPQELIPEDEDDLDDWQIGDIISF